MCISADLSSSLPALLKVVKLVYSERKQLEKILKSTSIRQQDRVGHLHCTLLCMCITLRTLLFAVLNLVKLLAICLIFAKNCTREY